MKIFLIPPFRILPGIGFAVLRDARRFNRYDATDLWTSWELLWFRVYRYSEWT